MSNLFSKYQLRLIGAQLNSFLSITLVLFLVSMAGLLIFNNQELADHVKEELGFSVMIKTEATQIDIDQLYKTIQMADFTRKIEIIDKDQAAEELTKQLGENFIDYLGYNPLFSTLEVKLKAVYAVPDSLNNIKLELEQWPHIQEVVFHENLIEKVDQNIKVLSNAILFVSIVFFMMAYSLISNTVRLIVYSNRFKIRTMQLIGATERFIAKPYLIQGAITGILASLLALFILLLITNKIESNFSDSFSFTFSASLILLSMLIGTGITVGAYFFAVKKYSQTTINEFFF